MPKSNKTGVVLNSEMSLVIGLPDIAGIPDDIQGLTITGWSDGVYLAFRQLDEGVSDTQGVTGEESIIISNFNRFEVDITLQQTSTDNEALSRLYNGTKSLGLVYPVTFEDASGQTRLGGTSGRFLKFADFGYAKDPETRTWTMRVGHMEGILGGNA